MKPNSFFRYYSVYVVQSVCRMAPTCDTHSYVATIPAKFGLTELLKCPDN